MLGLVAHMGRVNGAERLEGSCELDHLLGRRRRRRLVPKSGREPDGARLEGALQAPAHGGDLGSTRRAVEAVHGTHAQGRMADLARRVERGRGAVEGREIVGEAREVMLGRLAHEVERRRGPVPDLERGEAHAAVARDDRGDALAYLAGHERIGEQRTVIVGVHVDEAGCQRLAGCRDLRPTLERAELADRDDAIVLDREIADDTRRAAAVDEEGRADDKVRLERGGGRHGSCPFLLDRGISLA